MRDLRADNAEDRWLDQMRHRPRRNRNRKILSILLLIGAAALGVLAKIHGERIADLLPLTIREIVISNNRTIMPDEIFHLLGVRPGDSWWRYSPRSIRARLRSHPRIGDLDVRYAWFHRLHVEVTEREPVLAVVGATRGEITADGWFLPPRPVGEDLDLPILRTREGKAHLHDRRVDSETASVAALVGRLRDERPALWRQISEIQITERESRAFLRSFHGVIVFDPGRHEETWLQLPAVLEDLQRRDRDDVVLDLRFRGRVVVRMPDPAPSRNAAQPQGARKV